MLNHLKILDVSDAYLATLPFALFSLPVKTLRIKAANNALHSVPQEYVNQGQLAGSRLIELGDESSAVCATLR
jgi:hypothetical protein